MSQRNADEPADDVGRLLAQQRHYYDLRAPDFADENRPFWNPAELERRLQVSGWEADVRPFGETFLFGTATRPPRA